MGKILAPYAGFTAAQIIAKSSNTSDMVVSGTNVDCSNITVTKVKNVLGDGATSIGGLSTTSRVNKWSGFGPVTYNTSDNIVTPLFKTPYSLGNFAGYNHNAIVPYLYFPYPTNIRSSGEANKYQNIGCFINLGDVDWQTIWPNGTWFVTLSNDTTKVASFTTASVVGNTEMNIVLSLLAPAVGFTNSYTINTWIGNTSGGALNGKLTQCSNKTVTIQIVMSPVFASITAVNSQNNRDVAALKLSLDGSETVGQIWANGTGLSISALTNVVGTFNVYADITNASTGAFKRSVALCSTALMRGTLKAYKVNGTITSATYTVATLVRILPATGFTYAIPSALMPLADGDNIYLVFDSFN